MAMKLYLIKPRDDLNYYENPFGGYDSYDGFVVRAKNEVAARAMVPVGGEGWKCPDPWTNPKWSTCERLLNKGPEEIVLSSYNAG